MRPFPAELMRMWLISTRVNKPENDDSSILDPIQLTTDAAWMGTSAMMDDAEKLLHWQVAWLLPAQNTIHIRRCVPIRCDHEALWRTVSPNASLDASCRRLGLDIAFLCYTWGKLGPALTEEGLGHVVVADPANRFGRACGLPEAAAEGLPLHQRARGHKGALATRPAGALRRRADAIATDQYRAIEVEVVPIDSRQLKREWSEWPEFGSDRRNPRELSKG
jgi:hypothetical protein